MLLRSLRDRLLALMQGFPFLKEDPTRRMIRLPGGPFLMGTDYKHAFPDDGEGPVREVTLDPFWIDKFPVTNKLFARFVQEANYVTEAERFGWSFGVLGSCSEEPFLRAGGRHGSQPFPGGARCAALVGRHPEGPESSVGGRENYPVVQVSWSDAAEFTPMGGQAPADRSGMGVRGARRPGTEALPVGR